SAATAIKATSAPANRTSTWPRWLRSARRLPLLGRCRRGSAWRVGRSVVDDKVRPRADGEVRDRQERLEETLVGVADADRDHLAASVVPVAERIGIAGAGPIGA